MNMLSAIVELQAENKQLREALEKIADNDLGSEKPAGFLINLAREVLNKKGKK